MYLCNEVAWADSKKKIQRANRKEEEQSGAAEAGWAHNPEVDGSKPSSASNSLNATPL